MKIIVCGAGSVGKSIVSYLVKGNNDIVVIDSDQHKLDDISKEFDVRPLLGSASHPEILEKANARKAELLIAATDVDEVNMVACEVAHSLFNVPRKIARIDAQDFLEPIWATLYNEKSIPIDQIISPDVEIAKSIHQMLKIPGVSEALPLFDGHLHLLAFRLPKNCQLIKTPLLHLERIVPGLNINIVNVSRGGRNFIPYKNDMLDEGDEVYMLLKTEDIDNVITAFGLEHPAIERVVIFGGNQISRSLGRLLEKDDNILSCKIIEENLAAAQSLAKDLNETVVLHGEQMSDLILIEAGLANADAAVSVTMRDEDNLISSLLAQKSGVRNSISLINSPAYNRLIEIIGNSILVDRTTVTISSILKELRKSRISEAYALGRGFGEIWEMPIMEDNVNINKPICSVGLPACSKICAVMRDNDIFYPGDKDELKLNDKIILYVESGAIKKVEKFFP